MRVLVTGGAGYIGSVTAAAMVARGMKVGILDNLSTGHRAAVPAGSELFDADLLDTARVQAVMESFRPEVVVHFAALSLVGESVSDPARYMRNNAIGTLSLLDAMLARSVNRIVFSSTAAVYGEPESVPITEEQPLRPTNPYGLTKLFMEQAMRAYGPAYGLQSVCLRYFNAAGAAGALGEDHTPETHLIPLVLQAAAGKRESVAIFGTDYDTPDGTCIRDYIHVADLADAHLRAVDYLAGGGDSLACNLGNGAGYSVREVIDACRRVTGREIPTVEAGRREGDPARLVASARLAHNALGWMPARTRLEDIVADAWEWHLAHPAGYGS